MLGESAPPLVLDVERDGGTADATRRPDDQDAPGSPRHQRTGVRRRLHLSLTVWFLVIAAPIGTFLVFAIPPLQGLDEPNHFTRVMTIVDGTLVPPTVKSSAHPVEIGGLRATGVDKIIRPHLSAKSVVLSGCVRQYIIDNIEAAGRPGPMNDRTFFTSPPRCGRLQNGLAIIDNTAINSPVAYAAQVLGVGLLRAAGAGLPTVFYGGRLAGLLGYLALVALAIRLIPRGKGVLFLIAILPMSLEGAAAYSADGMTLALSLLVVALTVRCLLDRAARWPYFAGLCVAAWLLALCKEPYAVLALLILLVPVDRLRRVGRRELGSWAVRGIKVLATGVAALLAAWWYVVGVSGVSLAADYPPGAIAQKAQIHLLTHHPWVFTELMARSMFYPSAQGGVLSGAVSTLGFFRNGVSAPSPPLALIILAYVALFAAYRAEVGPRLLSISVRQRVGSWVPVAVVVVCTLLIYGAAAIRTTPAGALLIGGVQGRYLLPLAAVPVATVVLRRGAPERGTVDKWLVLTALVLAVYLVLKVFVRFY